MLAGRGDRVVRGKFIEEFDIGDQSRARKDAFEEIVTQQGILRHPPGESCLKCIDVVDPFANVGSLAKKVLVNVGDCSGIRINAARTGEDTLEKRSFAIGW